MEKIDHKRQELQCRIYPPRSLTPYKYVVICSYYNGQWLLSKHRDRDTWETQGGHIEMGPPLEAAKRELYEKSGVIDATLHYVCDYVGYSSKSQAKGCFP